MIANPGFSFSNTVGKYYIEKVAKTNMPDFGPLYSEAVICQEPISIKEIYSHKQSHLLKSNSIALQFSKININNNEDILKFCNNYGLTNSLRNVANFTNDYIFLQETKTSTLPKIRLGYNERTRLTSIKKEIVSMKLLIELSTAITNHDFDTIVKIIAFFCFDLTALYSEHSQPATELFQFNHAFWNHAKNEGYSLSKYKSFDFSSTICSFLNDLVIDCENENAYHQYGLPYHRKYIQFDHFEWRHIRGLFYDILSDAKILSVDPFGEVTFSKPLSEINYLQQLNENNLKNLAKAVLSDLFKETLHWISPEIQYENYKQISSWRIPDLLSAMYLELFFYYSPHSQIKLCADPTCKTPFQWTSEKPNQKYCSNTCALRVAKRNQRKRDKNKEKANANSFKTS